MKTGNLNNQTELEYITIIATISNAEIMVIGTRINVEGVDPPEAETQSITVNTTVKAIYNPLAAVVILTLLINMMTVEDM